MDLSSVQRRRASPREALLLWSGVKLLAYGAGCGGTGSRIRRELLSDIAVVPQVVVENARQLRCLRSESRPAPLEEEHGNDASMRSIRERGEPAVAGPVVRAR